MNKEKDKAKGGAMIGKIIFEKTRDQNDSLQWKLCSSAE